MKKADVEAGHKPGLTDQQAAELRELKKRNRLLEQENEVLLQQAHTTLGLPQFLGRRGGRARLDPGFYVGLANPLVQGHRVDPEVGGDLLERHTLFAVLGDADGSIARQALRPSVTYRVTRAGQRGPSIINVTYSCSRPGRCQQQNEPGLRDKLGC